MENPVNTINDINITILDAVQRYIHTVNSSRSANTASTYANGLSLFLLMLPQHGINPEETPVSSLTEEAVAWFASRLKDYAPSTERLYLTALVGFYDFLAGDNMAVINQPRIRLIIRQRARRPGVRLPQFPQNDIDKVLEYAEKILTATSENEQEKLRNLQGSGVSVYTG